MKPLTTTQELDATRALYRDHKLPKSAIEIMDAATADLENDDAASHSLQPGHTAPDFILPNVDGRSVRLYSELKKGPVVLVFYRGGWCPYCNIHLRGFQKLLAEFNAAGAQVVAISPQLPDQSLSTLKKDELAFPVLSDVALSTARAFGVAFELPKALLDLYADFEVVLDDVNGEEGAKELPMPATFVIRADRTLAYAHVEADFTRRSEPLEVLNLVRELENITA
ncbi:peroxiredoxin-like family protein [Prosthecobacter sp.]|uniref:peroxiredoxin-like family protein n=1 Tax=Prosthecobacter sp. TaxID=1965333 RepID=UPI003784A2DF